MYTITIRPKNTVKNTPRVIYCDNLLSVVNNYYRVARAIVQTYDNKAGFNTKSAYDRNTGMINVFNEPDGLLLLTIEVDNVSKISDNLSNVAYDNQ